MKKYTLELSQEHIQPLLQALDTFTRLKMGQFSTVFEVFPELSYDDRDAIHRAIRQVIFKDMHLGVFSPELSQDAKVAFDIYQVVRNARAWDNMGKDPNRDDRDLRQMWSVDYDPPMKCSGLEMPKMRVEPCD
jgi:hypothetical protein